MSHKPSDGKRFARLDADSYRTKFRLIMSIMAMDKCGKTRFQFTAPGPIACHNFDDGLEGVVDRFVGTKAIYVTPTKTNASGKVVPDYYRVPVKGEDDCRLNAAKAFAQFAGDFTWACEQPDDEIRTITVDDASVAWSCLGLAKPTWSPNQGDQARKSGENNAEWRDLINQVKPTSKNLILLHKMKEVYLNDNRTGKYELAGYKDTRSLVQLNALMWYIHEHEAKDDEVPGFHLRVINCRQNHNVIGVELVNEEIEFSTLGMMVFPDSEISDWI